jgi:hypothetical protein
MITADHAKTALPAVLKAIVTECTMLPNIPAKYTWQSRLEPFDAAQVR